MVNAGCTAFTNMPVEKSGRLKLGKPVGTSPITGVFVNQRTPISVPTINAASVGGNNFFSLFGQRTPTPRVTTAMASAPKLTLPITFGHSRTASNGPPIATGAPRNGSVCTSMIIMPMPDMKPEITEYGVNATNRPILIRPKRI